MQPRAPTPPSERVREALRWYAGTWRHWGGIAAAALAVALGVAADAHREELGDGEPTTVRRERLLVPEPPAPPDAPALLATVASAREALAGLPALWGGSASGIDWVLAGEDAAWVTRREGGQERLAPTALPPGTRRANSDVELGGRRLAMVMLPLPDGATRRVQLLVHEAMHVLQPAVLPAAGGDTEPTGPGADLLDGEEGRTWLFLELRALAAAMTSAGPGQREAAQDALRFRARRDARSTPAERARQDALDRAEGLPEYTALRLTGVGAAALAKTLEGAPAADQTWVRAAGYWTGPAYGYALDALPGAAWRAQARAGVRLPELLASAVGPRAPPTSRPAPGGTGSRSSAAPSAPAPPRTRAAWRTSAHAS